ncbi:hypothetical protein Efla_002590 [Eimeria flavescens]
MQNPRFCWPGRRPVLLALALGLLLLLQSQSFCAASGGLKGAEERLKAVFEQALESDPQFELPEDLQHLKGMSLKEKAEALAHYALQNAEENLEKWLGDGSVYVENIKKALKEKNKVNRAKAIQSALTSLFDQLLARLVRREMTCAEAKAKGVTPEVRLGHSPIKRFGYPMFIDGVYILNRRLPLNLINNFLIPITVGSSDYVIQGRPAAVLDFLECFSAYGVVAETLFPDGHWRAEAHDGREPRPLYLQVQGAMQGGSVLEILTRAALQRVVRSIDFKLKKQGGLSSFVEAALRGDLRAKDFLDTTASGKVPMLSELASYVNLSRSTFVEMVQEMNEAKTFGEKIDVFMRYLQGPEDQPGGWVQQKAVVKQSRITLTLTTYPQPNSTCVVKSTGLKLKKQGSLSNFVGAARMWGLRAKAFLERTAEGKVPLLSDIASYANVSRSTFVQMVKEMNKALSFEQKIDVFMRSLQGSGDEPGGWVQQKAVVKQSRITLFLTSYPLPDAQK